MNEDLNNKLQRTIKSITQMQLKEEDKALALAAIYVDYGRNDEAIEILEKLTNSGVQTASKYLILAGVYQRVRLYQVAEEKCEKALELAKAAGDIEEQAAAKAGLAQIKALLGKQNEAQSYLVNARNKFNALEKVEQNSEVKERLGRLRSLISGERQLLFAALGDCSGCNGQSKHRPSGFGGNMKCLYCGDG